MDEKTAAGDLFGDNAADFACITVRFKSLPDGSYVPIYDLGGFDEWAAIAILRACAEEMSYRIAQPRPEGEKPEDTGDDYGG